MYLIDTHILLWWLQDDDQLSEDHKALISNPSIDIYVSAASIWEVTIKKSLKKLSAPNNFLEIVKSNHFKLLPITPSHAWEVLELPAYHSDPFDRLLIAQAIVEKMPIITHDKHFKKYPVNLILA